MIPRPPEDGQAVTLRIMGRAANNFLRERDEARAEAERLRDALEAIADPSCGHVKGPDGGPMWDSEAGYRIAREALAVPSVTNTKEDKP